MEHAAQEAENVLMTVDSIEDVSKSLVKNSDDTEESCRRFSVTKGKTIM